jgi:UDP-N-acetylglucosamine acyltransferase
MNHLKIDPTVFIHPTAILEGDITIGANTEIGAGCYLKGPLVIGSNNKIGMYVMIGLDAEHATKPSLGRVIIGDNNTIREFVTIQRGIGDRETEIQNNCFLMAYSYIAHDSLIESDVIFSAKVALAGHCRILQGAIVGLGAVCHHYSTIGQYAFVGMGSVVNKDVPPFCVCVGNPLHFLRLNTEALNKLKLGDNILQIANGEIMATDINIKQYLEIFKQHSRRKILALIK